MTDSGEHNGVEGRSEESPSAETRRALFARVFAKHDRWLYAYLVTLLGNPADAEEVFQEVCVVLWRDYERFDPSTNFMKWASVIAHNQVRGFRRKLARNEHQLSDTVIDMLAVEAIEASELLEARRIALQECLKKLTPADLALVRKRYGDSSVSLKAVADMLGRPTNTVYKAMNRIRKNLHGCIDRTISHEGLA